MKRTISGAELRDRLLAQLALPEPPRSPDAWVEAMASPGNRQLLGLIGRERPRSINELSELAGRAQPSVSRSLTALISSGLVEVESDGRRSVPSLTRLGLEKAKDLKLLPSNKAMHLDLDQLPPAAEILGERLFSVSFDAVDHDASTDVMSGEFLAQLAFRGEQEPRSIWLGVDLNRFALHLLEHWWRIFYRRDAPFKLGDFRISRSAKEPSISCSLHSSGARVELIARTLASAAGPSPGRNTVSIESCELSLLEGVLRPLANELRSRMRYDRPLQSSLARLDDSRAHASEASFCKTVGALGLNPHAIGPALASSARDLIDLMGDEEARLDFASAVLTDLDAGQDWVRAELKRGGTHNRLHALPDIRRLCAARVRTAGLRPYEIGVATARALRETLDLAPDQPVGGVTGISRALGAEGELILGRAAPASLRAFQESHTESPTVVLEDEGPIHSAFVLARAVGDYLTFGSTTACVADLYTDRQAVGRAFGAELIAPAEAVVRMVEQEDQPMHRVAAHFGASLETVNRQFDNNYRRYANV